MAETIAVCVCLCVCRIFPILSSVDGHLVDSMVTNVNCTTLNIDVQMSLCVRQSANTQEWYDLVILSSVLRSFHVDSQKPILFSILTSSVYIRLPPCSVHSRQHLGLFS